MESKLMSNFKLWTGQHFKIYYNIFRYLAIFHSQLPGGESKHIFNQGEVKDVNYRFSPWNNITYKLGTKTTFLFEDFFKTPAEFHEMSTKKEQSF